jgi:hypothetical protein
MRRRVRKFSDLFATLSQLLLSLLLQNPCQEAGRKEVKFSPGRDNDTATAA